MVVGTIIAHISFNIDRNSFFISLIVFMACIYSTADTFVPSISIFRTSMLYCSALVLSHFKCICEASQIHLKWLRTRAEQYSIEVRNMLIEGTKVSAVEYIHAMNTIKEIKNEFLSILNEMCAIIVPTTIIPAPGFDERTISIDDDTFQTRKALLRNTIIFNSTGLPAVTIP